MPLTGIVSRTWTMLVTGASLTSTCSKMGPVAAGVEHGAPAKPQANVAAAREGHRKKDRIELPLLSKPSCAISAVRRREAR